MVMPWIFKGFKRSLLLQFFQSSLNILAFMTESLILRSQILRRSKPYSNFMFVMDLFHIS